MHNAGHFSGIMHLKRFRFEHAPENVSGAERDEIHPAGVAPIHWLRALPNGGTDALMLFLQVTATTQGQTANNHARRGSP